MKIVAFYSPRQVREKHLAVAVATGAATAGETAHAMPETTDLIECDVACFIGVKSLAAYRRHRDAGITTVYFDKGYLRKHWRYWRVAVNGHHPTEYVASARHGPARALHTGLMAFKPWQTGRHAILLDGASRKGLAFEDRTPSDITAVIDKLRGCGRPIIYRPKFSWREARPMAGTEYSRTHDCSADLERAHVLVTFSSNMCFEAACVGVPSIILGHGVARPISSTSLGDVDAPRLASDDERRQWLANVAWCQFTLQEFAESLGWRQIRTMIDASLDNEAFI